MESPDQPLLNTIKLLKQQLPEFIDVTKEIRSSGGFLKLREEIVDLLALEGLLPWSSFYDNPLKLKSLSAHTLIGHKKFKNFSKKVESLNDAERKLVKESLKSQIINKGSVDLDFDTIHIPTETDFDQWLDEAINSGNTDSQISLYFLLYTMLTQVFFYLAVMTFGRSMTDLVRIAQEGDDSAYFASVRIDKTLLFGLPYYQKRLLRAQISGDADFFQKLSNAIGGNSLGYKLSHRNLMFVFVVLEDEGFLDLPLKQLFDICVEVGVKGLIDPETLGKRRKYYKDKTGRQIRF